MSTKLNNVLPFVNPNTNKETNMKASNLRLVVSNSNQEDSMEFTNKPFALELQELIAEQQLDVEAGDEVDTEEWSAGDEIERDEYGYVSGPVATPTALESRGIYDCVTVKTSYVHNPKERHTYIKDGVKVVKLPTYHPVTEVVAMADEDYERKEQYINDTLNTDCDGAVVPSTEAIDELEEYATANMTRSSFTPNDDTFVRARLYQAAMHNSKLYRYDLKMDDIWFDMEDVDVDNTSTIISYIESHLNDMGLKFSDKLHIVISGNAVRRLTEERCEHTDEWQDKLHLFDDNANIYLQAPIASTSEENLFNLLEREFNAGIQTGRQFAGFDKITLGLWQDYLPVTEEVEARTKLEAERYVVTKKMTQPRKTSAIDKKACYESLAKVIDGLRGNATEKARLISTGAVAGINPDHIKPALAYVYAGGGKFFSGPIYYALRSLIPVKAA